MEPPPSLPLAGELEGSLCLLQDLLAVHDVDALLNLADALAGEVVDDRLLSSLSVFNCLDASRAVAEEVVSLNFGSGNIEVSLASLDGAGLGQIESCGLAFGLSQDVLAGCLDVLGCTLQDVAFDVSGSTACNAVIYNHALEAELIACFVAECHGCSFTLPCRGGRVVGARVECGRAGSGECEHNLRDSGAACIDVHGVALVDAGCSAGVVVSWRIVASTLLEGEIDIPHADRFACEVVFIGIAQVLEDDILGERQYAQA